MTRFNIQQTILQKGKYFKLVCGAGNEDGEEVKRLTVLYTLGGAKGLDISANLDVVKSCMEGIDIAFILAEKLDITLKIRPFVMVSIGMSGDHHVRKAFINPNICINCNLCIPTCPTAAIPDELVIIRNKCIGCGNCSAICPKAGAISYEHNRKKLLDILPKSRELGVENFELHAAVAEDDHILEEWEIINTVNPDGVNSMCLDRLHLSDFALESRIRKAKERTGERLLIQADGYPMSGGKDDYGTTLQAVACADVVNKRFNKRINKKTKESVYKTEIEVQVMLSGGTNSLTGILADQNDVNYQGVAIGTFARNLVKDVINKDDFYSNLSLIKQGYLIAKKLVVENIGEINEDNIY